MTRLLSIILISPVVLWGVWVAVTDVGRPYAPSVEVSQ